MTILHKWKNCHGEALVTFEKEHRWCKVQKQYGIHKYLKKLSINLNLYSNKGNLIQAK